MRFNSNCNYKLYRIIIMVMIGIILILVGYIVYDQINEHFNDRDPKLNQLKSKLEILFDSKKAGEWTGNLEALNNRNILDEIKLYVGSKNTIVNTVDLNFKAFNASKIKLMSVIVVDALQTAESIVIKLLFTV